MFDLMKGILGLVTGGASTAGGVIANVAAVTALLAALTPAAIGFFKHRDEVLVQITVGDAGFWCAIMGAFVFVIVKLAHRAPPP